MRKLGSKWSAIDAAALEQMNQASMKKRFEIRNGRIRATYGHSIGNTIERTSFAPPELLSHGTSRQAWESIRIEGLRPMGRENVHLSRDVQTAVVVGRRKSANPVILEIRALDAYESGHSFYYGNDSTWLADVIPANFIKSQ